MTKLFTSCAAALLLLSATGSRAQQVVTAPPADSINNLFKTGGNLWGYAFGDYAYKPHADTVGGGRGGSNQYTGVPKNTSEFQLRRVYLGYNFNLNQHFAAEVLLAAEDDPYGSTGATNNGDLLSDGKFSPYLKLANIRWRNIVKGLDVVIGEQATPAFPLLSEVVWGYRSIERTVADIRRTPSFDLGIGLQGHIDVNKSHFGFNLLAANGNAAKPENDPYKWFYGDVWAKLFNDRLIIDFYADYNRIVWNEGFHRDRAMQKLFIAYTSPRFTIGAEGFINTLRKDNVATEINGHKDSINTRAMAISVYARGRIYKDKLGAFARYDNYNPNGDLNNGLYTAYSSFTSQYNVNNKESFVTAGLDYTPIPNVHLMPNVWYDHYSNNATESAAKPNGYDIVYRLTFYFIFGKKEGVRF